MPKYINTDKIRYTTIIDCVGRDSWGRERYKRRDVVYKSDIDRMHTADVVPRAEIINAIFDDIEASIAVHAYTSKSEDYAEGACDTIEWVDSKIAELRKKYTGANDE